MKQNKMKALIICICLSLTFNVAFAQTHVALNPLEGQGYMLLDKQSNETINNWKVSLVKRTYNEEGTFDDVIIEKTKLPSGTNYIYIPAEYRRNEFPTHYLVNIEGLDVNEIVVASELGVHLNEGNSIPETNGGIPYALTNCRKICIGKTYAYKIQEYKQPNANLSMFRLETASKLYNPAHVTVNPYYSYSLTPSNYLTTVSFPSGSAPGATITVYDGNGWALNGTVYGNPKTRGWNNPAVQGVIGTPGSYALTTSFCHNTNTLTSAIGYINFHNPTLENPAYPNQSLHCIEAATPPTGGGGITHGDGSPHATFKDFVTFTFCYDENGDLVPCPISPSVIDPIALNPELIAFIQIKDLNNPTNPAVTIDVASLYNADGTFNGYNLNLAPSLYSFGFMFKDEGYWARIGEFQNTTNIALTEADMVDITVYPTPITDNTFDINVFGNITTSFVYELRDFDGELILSENMEINKDHEEVITITNDNIPEGILFHRFIFNDGSIKVIQTIKN